MLHANSVRAAEKVVKDIRRTTPRQLGVNKKMRGVHERLRGKVTVAEFCRREGIATGLNGSRSKEFLEVGKKRLAFIPLTIPPGV